MELPWRAVCGPGLPLSETTEEIGAVLFGNETCAGALSRGGASSDICAGRYTSDCRCDCSPLRDCEVKFLTG